MFVKIKDIFIFLKMTYQIIYDFMIKYNKEIENINIITEEDKNKYLMEVKQNNKAMNEFISSTYGDSNDLFSDSSDEEDDYTNDDNTIANDKVKNLIVIFLNSISSKIPEMKGLISKLKNYNKLCKNTLTIKGLIDLLNEIGQVYYPTRYINLVNKVFEEYKDKMISNVSTKHSKFRGIDSSIKLRLDILEDSIYMNNEIIREKVKNEVSNRLENNNVLFNSIRNDIINLVKSQNERNNEYIIEQVDNHIRRFDYHSQEVEEAINKKLNMNVIKCVKEEVNKINVKDKMIDELKRYSNDNTLFIEYLKNLDIKTVIDEMLKSLVSQNINMTLLNDKFKNELINKVDLFTTTLNDKVKHNIIDEWINKSLIKQHRNKYLLNKTNLRKSFNLSKQQLEDKIKDVLKCEVLSDKILMTVEEVKELINQLN